jgi:hypothetical protein
MGKDEKIVVEHHPVDRLPEDLRQGSAVGELVKVTIEADTSAATQRPISDYFGKGGGVYSGLDPVDVIRALRDEWE